MPSHGKGASSAPATMLSDKPMAPYEGRGLTRWGHARARAYHLRTRARCRGMHCTVTSGRLFMADMTQQAPHCQFTTASQGDPPIYAALVREWRVSGRMLPGAQDAQWTILISVSPAMTGQQQHSSPAPRPGRWERAVELPLGHQARLVPTR